MSAMISGRTKLLTSVLVGCVALWACGGPREPGARANETIYWKVASSDVAFGACSDDNSDGGFRQQIQAVEFEENSYFVYRISGDAKTASVMACKTFSPSSCVVSEPELKFDVTGNELHLTRELKTEIGDGGCNLQTTQQWIAEDKGTSMSLDVSNTLSLVDQPTECARIENIVKRDSPNGLGFQGCVVTYKLGFTQQ